MPPDATSSRPDGETRTSRVVGSIDFCRPKVENDESFNQSLTVVEGVQCSMPYVLKCSAAAHDDNVQEQMTNVAKQVFEEVDAKLNTFLNESEVSLINRNLNVGVAHVMSEPLRQVMEAAKDVVKATRGAFDPSVGPLLNHYKAIASKTPPTTNQVVPESTEQQVVNVWKGLTHVGFSDEPNNVAVSKKVQQIQTYSQWNHAFSVGEFKDAVKVRLPPTNAPYLHRERNDICIVKRHERAALDLNGIAKGWAVDEIARLLPSPCYVEWGGDIKVRGKHPSGRNWTVAVPEPPTVAQVYSRVAEAKRHGQMGPIFTLSKLPDNKSETKYLAVLELRDGQAVATSGDCETLLEKDGKIYALNINPRLGRLLQLNDVSVAQAVVVCSSCMYADALATAAVSMEHVARARSMLDPLRTGFHCPVADFLLYSRQGPRIVRLTIPGVETAQQREKRLEKQAPHASKVIVVGSGLAGMSAAIEAANAGASVILLEKETRTGGNSAKATSGINGWGTETQATQGIADDERLFERDTFRSGRGGSCTPSLVRTLSTQSSQAIQWLQHRFHIPLTVLSQLGGHSAKRTHRAPPDEQGRPVPIGYLITKTLRSAIDTEYKDKIEVLCGHRVTRLQCHVGSEGIKTVNGVEVVEQDSEQKRELHADAVVLATGGFGCDQASNGLMHRFRPDLLGTPTTNGSFAQGDGVLMGEEIGAELIDMDKVQLHPTGFIDPKQPDNPTKFLAPEAIRGSGGILVNSKGIRFVNELDLRSVVAKAIQDHCSLYKSESYVGPPFAWCILSKPAQELFGLEVLGFYKDKLGLFEECEDVKEASSLIGCDEQSLRETLDAYAESAEQGTCLETGKDIFPSEINGDSKGLVIARVTPSIHYTMGGVNINAAGEVLERYHGTVGSHRHIRRLYAAGEVTGGVHGNNRLGGNSLLECVVFGRIAGERAASCNHPDRSMFVDAGNEDDEKHWYPVVLREIRNTDKKYGMNTREVRFNLHGGLQTTGLDVGQYIALRGEMDGETLIGYFSPITRPGDEGVIGILYSIGKGPITDLLEYFRPGSALYICPMGGLRLKFEDDGIFFRKRAVKRIGLLAGGTGVAPMLQIIRAYNEYASQTKDQSVTRYAISLIYAAEQESDLAYVKALEDIRNAHPKYFRFYLMLNRPPMGWTEGVGFIEPQDIKKQLFYPPKEGDLVVMCGPPIFEAAMRKTLQRLGFDSSQWFSFAVDDNVTSRS